MPAHAVASYHYSKFPWLGTIFHVDEKKQSNFNQIKTCTFSNLNDIVQKSAFDLIKNHFLRNGKNFFNPDFSNNFLP